MLSSFTFDFSLPSILCDVTLTHSRFSIIIIYFFATSFQLDFRFAASSPLPFWSRSGRGHCQCQSCTEPILGPSSFHVFTKERRRSFSFRRGLHIFRLLTTFNRHRSSSSFSFFSFFSLHSMLLFTSPDRPPPLYPASQLDGSTLHLCPAFTSTVAQAQSPRLLVLRIPLRRYIHSDKMLFTSSAHVPHLFLLLPLHLLQLSLLFFDPLRPLRQSLSLI